MCERPDRSFIAPCFSLLIRHLLTSDQDCVLLPMYCTIKRRDVLKAKRQRTHKSARGSSTQTLSRKLGRLYCLHVQQGLLAEFDLITMLVLKQAGLATDDISVIQLKEQEVVEAAQRILTSTHFVSQPELVLLAKWN
eukprot:COSAG02_NODE_4376_length_5437_cov_3.803484_2_plen_137_part_00